ncbi:MAG TPA: hypothetical protein VL021_04200 [Brumimicrobium sp.]|nr:hypothetical protein [Brumimicrobium sp.]
MKKAKQIFELRTPIENITEEAVIGDIILLFDEGKSNTCFIVKEISSTMKTTQFLVEEVSKLVAYDIEENKGFQCHVACLVNKAQGQITFKDSKHC